MPSVPTPNVVTVSLGFTFSLVSAYNVFNVKLASPATAADLIAIANTFDNWHNIWQRQQMLTICQLGGIVCVARDTPTSPTYIKAINPLRNGVLVSANPPPSTTAACIRWGSGLAGRQSRGRTYHFGAGQVQMNGVHNFTQAYANNLQSAYDNLRTTCATAGYPLVVLSLYKGYDVNHKPLPRLVGVATPITSCTVQTRVASMRKRQIPVVS